jgi:hypothetical protein
MLSLQSTRQSVYTTVEMHKNELQALHLAPRSPSSARQGMSDRKGELASHLKQLKQRESQLSQLQESNTAPRPLQPDRKAAAPGAADVAPSLRSCNRGPAWWLTALVLLTLAALNLNAAAAARAALEAPGSSQSYLAGSFWRDLFASSTLFLLALACIACALCPSGVYKFAR